MRAVVTGAGGFIGSHLVAYLKDHGYWVRGVDIKAPEFGPSVADSFVLRDLRNRDYMAETIGGVDEVYHLAANMGGIGYITANHAEIARDNVLMDTNVLHAAHQAGVERYFYASSACVYPQALQGEDGVALREQDVYPADAERGYGWEKLWAEQLADYYHQDYGMPVRVARFHNVYGPAGTYDGGKEKAPAALCRKVALASDGDTIEVWGDGEQRRSFLYITDCVRGIHAIAQGDVWDPLNLGSDEQVSITELAEMIVEHSGKHLRLRFDERQPQGVRSRNSDNRRITADLGFEVQTLLREGIGRTYDWIADRLSAGAGATELVRTATR